MRFALLLLALFPCSLRAADRPNVILFLIDDLGATDLRCTGSDFHETPNIDRLAKQGLRFTQAYSACTVCSPTRAALLTGNYPARLHITDWIQGHKRPNAKLLVPDWTMYLPRETSTIAEVLKENGYATGTIGKWHLGTEKQGYPGDHGFDFAVGGCEKGQPPSYFSPYKIPTLTDGRQGEYLTDREGDEACGFIEKNKGKPFFLYMPHHAVHTPIQAKPELVARFKAKLKDGMKHTNPAYAAMLFSLDEAIGKIVAKLDELKLADNTLIIFTSDNGGLLKITNNIGIRAGKGSAYEGGIRIPAIVRWPGVVPMNSESAEPIITMDWFRTVIDATRSKWTTLDDGVSLISVLKDPSKNLERGAMYWHYPHYHPGGATPYSAVRVGPWKLIEFFEDAHVELYDLKNDPEEKTDLAKKEIDRVQKMRLMLEAWRLAVDAQLPTMNPNFKE